MWLIDREIRRLVKKSQTSIDASNDTEVSISDSETSSDDTRPIVPEKINKPDISLKNKILKTINKSLLSSELSGIDLNMLKLNDHVRRSLKRVEKRALERDLEHDLIRSFSCSHLIDLRREDIKYTNMKRRASKWNSYSLEDIADLHMPKMLESYKLKVALEKERQLRASLIEQFSPRSTSHQTPMQHGAQSPSVFANAQRIVPVVHTYELNTNQHYLVTTPPPPQQIKSPLSPGNLNSTAFRSNPNNLFQEIMQERLNEIDHRIAFEIISSKKQQRTKVAKVSLNFN